MILNIFAIIIRIFSNSFLNVFQKLLTKNDVKSCAVNFYTYLGLSVFAIPFFIFSIFNINFSFELIINVILMGICGALGNYFIIKSLSISQLSTIAPINSYKPIIALIFGYFYLKEIPNLKSFFGIFIIILSTFFLFKKEKTKISQQGILYRFLGLIFSGIEAIFIKKIILLTNSEIALYFWILSGFIFSFFMIFISKIKPSKLSKENIKTQIMLIICVILMQYSTNYVFSKFDVSSSLALFQLSTILSIFLGANIFKEKDIIRKLICAFFMILGAILIILN